MHDISLKLVTRGVHGKKVAQLRKDGLVPSIVYGGQDEPIATQSQDVETLKVVRAAGKHSPIKLLIDDKKQLAIIKDIAIDPVHNRVLHVAFHAIKQNEIITTEVPIVLTGIGESAAEKVGLIVLQAIEHVEIKAKPANLPESLEISIAHLATDEDKITLADITLPEGVEYADVEQDLDLVVANVYEPAALEAANEASAGPAEEVVEETEEVEETTDAQKAEAKTE